MKTYNYFLFFSLFFLSCTTKGQLTTETTEKNAKHNYTVDDLNYEIQDDGIFFYKLDQTSDTIYFTGLIEYILPEISFFEQDEYQIYDKRIGLIWQISKLPIQPLFKAKGILKNGYREGEWLIESENEQYSFKINFSDKRMNGKVFETQYYTLEEDGDVLSKEIVLDAEFDVLNGKLNGSYQATDLINFIIYKASFSNNKLINSTYIQDNTVREFISIKNSLPDSIYIFKGGEPNTPNTNLKFISGSGKYIDVYEDAEILGFFTNGQKDSLWIDSSVEGYSKSIYSKGLLNGEYLVYESSDIDNSNLLYKTNFTKGTGRYKTFGRIAEEGNLKKGRKDGMWIYSENNRKLISGNYFDGLKDGEWLFFNNEGSVYLKKQYKKGYLIKYEFVKSD